MKDKCLLIINKKTFYNYQFLNEILEKINNFKIEHRNENLQYVCEKNCLFLSNFLGKNTKHIEIYTLSQVNFEKSNFVFESKQLNFNELFNIFKYMIFIGFNSNFQISINCYACLYGKNTTLLYFNNNDQFGAYIFC